MERPGTVIKLDRGFPLVSLPAQDTQPGELLRCEHATALIKGSKADGGRPVIGDNVIVDIPNDHDMGIIQKIEPRTTAFVRKDPADRTSCQVLAANFQKVIVVEPIDNLNRRRLERELVLAHDTGADVAVVLTKTDLMDPEQTADTLASIQALAGNDVPVLGCTRNDPAALAAVGNLVAPGDIAILIGKSGVGKSSLVNALADRAIRNTQEVRARDGKGRHTTVDRALVQLPNGGSVVDMPGVRGLGLWDADQGLDRAFSDIAQLANECRFRDCTHNEEPDCAVRLAVENGALAPERLESYKSLAAELATVKQQREEARRIRKEKPVRGKKKKQ